MRIDEFLLARIAEDEAVAREATDDGHSWLVEDETIGLWPDDREPVDGFLSFPRKAHAYHVANWQPSRVLAECAAKRATIADIFAYEEKIDWEWGDCHMADQIQAGECPGYGPAGTGAIEGLRILAAVYADHPDYRPEWAG